jgi:N6-L-threonylcarbamoyladenine synthase
MQAHLLVHFIKDEFPTPTFPFIGVTVSGGHTQIIKVKDYLDFELLGTTLDDAIGEAFDKCGKVLGLGYPAGPIIDQKAKSGNSKAFEFPIPKILNLNLSFSGFKTAVINFIHKNTQKDKDFIKNNLNDLCASIQYTLIEIIFQKIEKAVDLHKLTQVVLGGGVSANSGLRLKLEKTALEKGWDLYLPPLAYTTDNAAMIGIIGYLKYLKKDFGNIKESASARLKF